MLLGKKSYVIFSIRDTLDIQQSPPTKDWHFGSAQRTGIRVWKSIKKIPIGIFRLFGPPSKDWHKGLGFL